MRIIRQFAGLLHTLFGGYTLIAYALCFWPVSPHWVAGFVMMSVPLVMFGHLLILFFGALLGSKKAAIKSLTLLLLSFPFWSRTFRMGDADADPSAADFGVLSYNVHKMGVGVVTDGEKPLLSEEGTNWLKDKNADLLCFQESYHRRNGSPDLVAALGKLGYRHFVFDDHKIDVKPSAAGGLAFFSRYPLRNFKQQSFEGENGLMMVDVILPDDTLSVINVHLQSMTLNLRELIEQRQMDGLKSESKKTFSRMKKGFLRRNDQIEILEDWVKSARHPVIVSGDFNETPYSYAYGRLSELLANGFEEGGSGFGFTFRNLPYFIRIDNQFYDPDKIELVHFETSASATFSDHRPIIGHYDLKARR